jgi:hypothetical protein
MPQSIIPEASDLAILTNDEQANDKLDDLRLALERLLKQAEQVTGLELEEGDI